jgi:large subunit ribosomal protein L22
MEVKSTARNVRVSPQKVRLILDRLPGLSVDQALALLRFTTSPHAQTVSKVVLSAASNAENNFFLDVEELYVKHAFADRGPVLKRFKARSRGRASPIHKPTAHITVVLDEREY